MLRFVLRIEGHKLTICIRLFNAAHSIYSILLYLILIQFKFVKFECV